MCCFLVSEISSEIAFRNLGLSRAYLVLSELARFRKTTWVKRAHSPLSFKIKKKGGKKRMLSFQSLSQSLSLSLSLIDTPRARPTLLTLAEMVVQTRPDSGLGFF